MKNKPSKDTDKLVWRTIHFKLESNHHFGGFREDDYKGLVLPGHESILAVPAGGSQWVLIHLDGSGKGKEVNRLYRGVNHSIVKEWILKSERQILEKQEAERKWEEERPLREAEEAKQKHLQWLDLHGPGLYIAPLCKIDDSDSDENEGNIYGPFQDDDQNGLGGPEEAEALYWSAIHDARHELSNDNPINLIEAASRDDALKGIGHVWITNGIERGPAVDPRQVTLPFDTGLRPRAPRAREPEEEPQTSSRAETPTSRPIQRKASQQLSTRAKKPTPSKSPVKSTVASRMRKLLSQYK